MTRKRRRLIFVLAGMGCLGIATALVLNAFDDNLVFFYSPTDIAQKHPGTAKRLRIGGLVETGSLTTSDGGKRFNFKVTDGKTDMAVSYVGVAPALFREGQGVVAEGKLGADGSFAAATLLAKHDEKYMPPEVAAALKKSGEWRPDGQAAAPGAADKPAESASIKP
ncbi:MAG TPA: cytochrome c maturation protein CcmE [Aliidongia sp.]|uniref:cytochrome c maturation protein CcmE n=1 Tax=Aliidongia sp. TaxID=1914230 RepID=UPI002DDD1B58|nr:cytochrome c maturation protein CcmE [Aliidongia sp.]HEV2678266.1 cytochrome c maturation protein CcmE [Aliidongia sp.]